MSYKLVKNLTTVNYTKGPAPIRSVRKTVSVPAVMSAGTVLAYIVAV